MYVKCVCHTVSSEFEKLLNEAILDIRSQYRLEDRTTIILDIKYVTKEDCLYGFIEWDYEEEVAYD